MKPEETVQILKLMQEQVEWDYPMDYATAIDRAIEALEKQAERPEKKTDTISLATALELPVWRIIEAGEPSRQIDVRMTYEDLGIIYDMIREKHRIEDDRK